MYTMSKKCAKPACSRINESNPCSAWGVRGVCPFIRWAHCTCRNPVACFWPSFFFKYTLDFVFQKNNFSANFTSINISIRSVERYCTGYLVDEGSRLTQCKSFKILFWYVSTYKYKNLKENVMFFVPLVSSLTSYKFYNSIWELYISNLGARPVLVHFWDYIFRIWITV